MALPCQDLHTLNHELYSLLCTLDIDLTLTDVERFIAQAHIDCLKRLQHAALTENLISHPILCKNIDEFLKQLLVLLQRDKSASVFYRWDTLKNELYESIANEAMALAYRHHWQQKLRHQARNHVHFWGWLNDHYSPNELLPFLEQWGAWGHPYHPNFRAKIGFNRAEILQYSPEFHAEVKLHWLALHHKIAKTYAIDKPYNEVMIHAFPKEYKLWQDALLQQKKDPKSYHPLPVHPWQWQNRLQKNTTLLLEKHQLFLFPYHQSVHPSLSFRTMMPLDTKACHLKLATAIHTTSATRTVSPASIQNGRSLSIWLSELLTKHDHYQQSLFLAKDLAGLHIATSDFPLEEKQCALILRENPRSSLKDNQQLVPLAALFSPSPLTLKPLLCDIIDMSRLAPQEFFAAYCRCVLTGQLHLLLKYGVAFEAHQQNTLVVFKNNLPNALIMRDLGGICVCNIEAYQHEKKPILNSTTTIVSDNLADVCGKFVHGNFISNLSYWVHYLNDCYSLPKTQLWRIVFHILDELIKGLPADVNPRLVAEQRQHLFIKPWQYKSLLTMRLQGKGEQHTFLYNPLSQFL